MNAEYVAIAIHSILLYWSLISIGTFFLHCLCLQAVAEKLEVRHSWLAWVPYIQFALPHIVCARSWYIFVFAYLIAPAGAISWAALGFLRLSLFFILIPVLYTLFLYGGMAYRRQISIWFGIFALLPIIGIVPLLYLAFHDGWGFKPFWPGVAIGLMIGVSAAVPYAAALSEEEAKEEAQEKRELEALVSGLMENKDQIMNREFVKTATENAATILQKIGNTSVALSPVPEGTVVVYSAAWCGYCRKAMRWMEERKIPFVERDIEKMPEAQKEMREKLAAAGISKGGIPVIDWGGTLVMGFDQRKLAELYRKTLETQGDKAATESDAKDNGNDEWFSWTRNIIKEATVSTTTQSLPDPKRELYAQKSCPPSLEEKGARPHLGFESWCVIPSKPDVRHGDYWKWHPDGSLASFGAFSHGKREGTWLKWHRNGFLAAEAQYEDGEQNGTYEVWSEDGRLENKVRFEDGKAFAQ